MLITTGNPELVSKLITLAGGDIDLVQLAIRTAAKGGKFADLENVVKFIARRRNLVADAGTDQPCGLMASR